MILKGNLYEVGNLEDSSCRGVRIEREGGVIEITGLSENECREIGKSLWDIVTVTIEPVTNLK